MFRSSGQTRFRKQVLGRYRYVRLRWRVLFALIDFAGTLAFGAGRVIGAALSRFMASAIRRSRARGEPRAIVLVQLDHLGDGVISTALLPPLRARYPHARIEVLAGPWNREVFEALPEVDCVYVSRVNRFSRASRLGWMLSTIWWGLRLRRGRFDLAIDVRGEFPLALMLWLSGAPRRLGWDCGGGGFLLTDSPRFVPGRPEIESRRALLACIGIAPDPKQPWRPRFRPSDGARRRVARQLAEFSQAASDGPLIVLHVGAGTSAKRWPAEHWRSLLGRLSRTLGARIVLVGSPDDRPLARAIVGPHGHAAAADWAGGLCIDELAALFERADLVVGADSGPAHLAAAVGAPVIVLFSGTNDPVQWQPRGERVHVLRRRLPCSPCHLSRCPLRSHPCMQDLTPAQVAETVEETLQSGAGAPMTKERWETTHGPASNGERTTSGPMTNDQ